ncbi:MAG: SxtJ family membrane protein [Sulfitobacter sp.]
MSETQGNTDVKMGSERSFGLVFCIVFLIVALWPLMGGGAIRIWSTLVAGVFLILAFVAPNILKPLNVAWFKFGLLLNKIVSPIVMGLIYFLTVTPIGLYFRARGKDLLNQKLDPSVESYWIEVDEEYASKTSMKKQF